MGRQRDVGATVNFRADVSLTLFQRGRDKPLVGKSLTDVVAAGIAALLLRRPDPSPRPPDPAEPRARLPLRAGVVEVGRLPQPGDRAASVPSGRRRCAAVGMITDRVRVEARVRSPAMPLLLVEGRVPRVEVPECGRGSPAAAQLAVRSRGRLTCKRPSDASTGSFHER
jgi:hypothetical protein